jgi:hypothetical protein
MWGIEEEAGDGGPFAAKKATKAVKSGGGECARLCTQSLTRVYFTKVQDIRAIRVPVLYLRKSYQSRIKVG